MRRSRNKNVTTHPGTIPNFIFFHGQNVILLAHAIIKDDDRVPDEEIERAIYQRDLFTSNPELYTYTQTEEDSDEENQ